MESKHRIGILGGTFDPIHLGHLLTAEAVRDALGLDEILFIPAAIPPHKRGQEIAPPEHRLRMAVLATAANPYFRVSDIEHTSVCPLARVMRSECRKRGIRHLKVVYSTEPPLRPLGDAADIRREEALDESVRRDIPGSTAFVPSAAGLIIAGEVVKDLAGALIPRRESIP